MNIRPKTFRRVMILLAGVALVCGLAVAAWRMSVRREDARLAAARSVAMENYAAGDYATAVVQLGDYIDRSKSQDTDPEALFAYGKSRVSVSMPRGKHLFEGINIFQRYLSIRPGDREARQVLTDLYLKVGYDGEALKLADQSAAADGKDASASWSRVKALVGLARRDKAKLPAALSAAEALVKLAPDDLAAQLVLQTLKFERVAGTGDDRAQQTAPIVAAAEAAQAAHPNDARFELLLSEAYRQGDQPAKAVALLKAAAARTPPDAKFARELVAYLDRARLYRDAQLVLERSSFLDQDPQLLRMLVQRQYETEDFEAVAKRLESLDVRRPATDSDLAAYLILSLYELNRVPLATPLLAALSARKDDDSVAWASAIRARYTRAGTQPTDPRELLKVYEQSIKRAPDNAVFRQMLGEAYLSMGETELAISAWRDAAMRSRAWSTPLATIARVAGIAGRNQEALEAAEEALRRSPYSIRSHAGLAVAQFALLGATSPHASLQSLLDRVVRIQAQRPGESETLPIQAALLARLGKPDEARAVISAALQRTPPPASETLLRLAAVSSAEKLGVEQDVLGRVAETKGLTPEIAWRQAIAFADAGKPDEGLKLLNESARSATGRPRDWRMAIAQYRERLGDESVLPEWISLGDANPNDLNVQSAILRANSRQRDRAFWARTIDRVKALTSDGAVLWQMERARWLLAGAGGDKELAEAINIVTAIARLSPELPEPRRLLAIALEKAAIDKSPAEKANFLKRAVEELAAASDLRPGDPTLTQHLTRLLRASGRAEEADQYLEKMAASAATLTPDALHWLADSFIRQGRPQRAIDLLAPMGDGVDPQRDAALAKAYARAGKPQQAKALYNTMLADVNATTDGLAAGADFYLAANDPAQAQNFVDALVARQAQPGAAQVIQAQFAERSDRTDDAARLYHAATEASGAGPAIWRELAGFLTRQRQFDRAIAAVDAGLKRWPGDADLAAFRARDQALSSFAGDGNVDELIVALAKDPRNTAATDLLRVLNDARTTKEPPETTAAKLRQVADRYPEFLPAQAQAVNAYVALRQFKPAEQVALRSMLMSPADPSAHRLLVVARMAAGQWQTARQAAQAWREASLSKPGPADRAIAQAMVQLDDFPGAARTLEPYVTEAAVADGAGSDPALINLYASALIGAGRSADAVALLMPLAQASPSWRSAALALAGARHANGAAAAKWVSTFAPLVPPGDAVEQLRLAQAWNVVGQLFGQRAAFERAAAILGPLAQGATVAPPVLLQHAAAAEGLGDVAGAESSYRALIRAAPDMLDARNNLAFLLLSRGTAADLSEAQALAEKVVADAPRNTNFRDTLGRAYAKINRLADAITQFRAALEIDPGNVEPMIGLADALARTGRREEARSMLARIGQIVQASPAYSAALAQQVAALRAALGTEPTATRPTTPAR